jgi:microcystin degradation protein MlrC
MADGVLAAGRLDGLLLHLHGALVTTDWRTDLDFVRDLRARIGDALPIVGAFDLHGNMDPGLADHLLALVGYRESPHIDMAETGERAARLMIGHLRGALRPVMVMRKVPLVLPSIFTATCLAPLADIQAAARRMEAQAARLLDISIFTGFAYSDVPMLGFTVVAVSDGDRDAAAQAADTLAERIWRERHALYKRDQVRSVAEAVAHVRAAPRTGRPIVLLEHADRGEDSTYVLRALLAGSGLRVAVPYLLDPEAAARIAAAGVGASVTVTAGGRSSDKAGGSVTLTGKVLFAGLKSYIGTGPMRRGQRIDLGVTSVLDCDGVVVWLISHSAAAIDLDPFLQFGFAPESFDVILLRSKTHFRAAYEPIAQEIVIVDTPDWGPADLATLPYSRVRPGVFPVTLSTGAD